MKKLSKKIKITLISCISILSLGVIAGTASGITLASYDRTKPLLADNEFGTDYDLRVETKYGENNSNINYLRGQFNGSSAWRKLRLTQLETAGYYGAIVTFAAGNEWKLWQDDGSNGGKGNWLAYGADRFSEGADYVKEGAKNNNNEMKTGTGGTYIFSFNSTSSKISLVKIS